MDTISLGPITPVIGNLLSAAAGALVVWLWTSKRKVLTFTVRVSEDLTLPLQQHHPNLAFRIGEYEMFNLNPGSVRIRNTGNTSISNVEFEITVPGTA